MTEQSPGISVSQGPAPDVVERIRAQPNITTLELEAATTIASLREQVESEKAEADRYFAMASEFGNRVSVLEGALEQAREEIVLAIAFLGRDMNTSRIHHTAEGLIERLAKADAAANEALKRSLPVNAGSTSSDGGRLSDVLTPLPREEADALAPFMKGMSDAPSETRSPDTARVADRDWTEDFAHENGNYECLCHNCGNIFNGHKRRVTCRACVEARSADNGVAYKAITVGANAWADDDQKDETFYFVVPASADIQRLMTDQEYCVEQVVCQSGSEDWARRIATSLTDADKGGGTRSEGSEG